MKGNKGICLILMLLCLSCQHRNEPRDTASRFLNIVCGKDTGDYALLYPSAEKLNYLLRLEQYRIKNSVCIDSDKVKVGILAKYQKEGKMMKRNIMLFLRPKNQKDLSLGYSIYDSKGLIDINPNDSVYTYAYWNGYIHDGSTDQEVAIAMKICKFYVVIHNRSKGLEDKK